MRMRSMVTLDPDVEMSLRREARRRGKPLKYVLNEAIREGLGRSNQSGEALEPSSFDTGGPMMGLAGAASLASGLEDDEFVDRDRGQ